MAGSLTLGGMSDGLLIGELIVGPVTMAGRASIGEAISVEMVPNTDFVVKKPPEAVGFALVFTFTGGGESVVNMRTDQNDTDAGLPILASAWFGMSLASNISEIKFKAAAPPSVFQLTFV